MSPAHTRALGTAAPLGRPAEAGRVLSRCGSSAPRPGCPPSSEALRCCEPAGEEEEAAPRRTRALVATRGPADADARCAGVAGGCGLGGPPRTWGAPGSRELAASLRSRPRSRLTEPASASRPGPPLLPPPRWR